MKLKSGILVDVSQVLAFIICLPGLIIWEMVFSHFFEDISYKDEVYSSIFLSLILYLAVISVAAYSYL